MGVLSQVSLRTLCLLLAIAIVAPPSWATTARQFSNEDLAKEADVVVVGTCAAIRTAWVDRSLVTLATIQVTESLRGGGNSLTVVLPGGMDANRPVPVMMSYPGGPQIVPDEEVFLFLEDETAALGGYTVLGFSQGKFSIVRDAQGRKVVERDLTKINLESGTGVTRGTRTLTSLQEFKDEIRRNLANR